MEHDYKKIAIIGAGAAGCMCAYFLSKSGLEITLFDKNPPLRTLLPTGGGRCNLAYSEYDFKELAKNYPRGEKFLYSVFSKFSTADTIETFEDMGIKTYIQENGRIFPNSNSSRAVRETLLGKIRQANFIKEKVIGVEPIDGGFKISTKYSSSASSYAQKSVENQYYFTHVIFALGGHAGYELIEKLGINIIDSKPSLVGLNTQEDFKELNGIVVKSANCDGIEGDMLFTRYGVSGPLIYTISSLKAFDLMPYKLHIDLVPELLDLQKDLNIYPHKEIKNIMIKYLPQRLVSFVLKDVDATIKAHKINGKMRDYILDKIHNFEIEVIGTNKGEETVTAGGIDLDEINPRNMEFKKIPNLYAIGEVLNIDGFCGGFNLQNAWSTAYVCAKSID